MGHTFGLDRDGIGVPWAQAQPHTSVYPTSLT